MKTLFQLGTALLVFCATTVNAQIISQLENVHSCGSHEVLKHIDSHERGFMEEMDNFTQNLASSASDHSRNEDIYEIPVVFHVIYNSPEENLPDSVIMNQLDILNAAYRRTNEDAINTRPEFLDIVGDAHIEFRLADFDPDGTPTTGITRTASDVAYFGGVLPYGPGQNSQISTWVNDSLFYNYFRMADSNEGGIEAWDPSSYLNIFIGDMRIFEPEFGNFEELVFFGIATPPLNHFNWPSNTIPAASNYQDGVFMHYVNIGSNNPNTFPTPYNTFNGITNTGKMLVHEVGHYLGLRHIWGDGNCSVDDFIDDTPNANIDSQWACNASANSCTDDIGGLDLPNMIENYMDYSSGDCQNAFTQGQIDLMRAVLTDYRPELAEVFVGVNETSPKSNLKLYPNPNQGNFTLEFDALQDALDIRVYNGVGQVIHRQNSNGSSIVRLSLDLQPGFYLLEVNSQNGNPVVQRFVVE